GDTTRWVWRARAWPPGAASPSEIRVRLRDQTAATADPLQVTPTPPGSPAPTGRPGDNDPVRLHLVRFASERGRLRVGVDLAADAMVQLELFDVQGRRVATLARGLLAHGSHEYQWDGRGRDGRPAGAGVYLVRLITPAAVRVVRGVLIP
ncbi:MAG: FlgD immunoglobulin-like domain containing protein, partial [Candidatus Eiseniibacteriota bacterium]